MTAVAVAVGVVWGGSNSGDGGHLGVLDENPVCTITEHFSFYLNSSLSHFPSIFAIVVAVNATPSRGSGCRTAAEGS